ncbi:MAG TPA: enoyl-CoA hydratase/isomerase family protein [Streptosporangiaceae bacterium]
MISLDRDGDVWILRMAAGENRFNLEWLDAVNTALDEVTAAAGPGALVSTGQGKFYTNGLDLDWLAGYPDAGAFLTGVNQLNARLLTLPLPTVAAVNGHAFGAGAVLAIAHDILVMRADRGYWCMPEADLGLPVTGPMYAVLETKLPRRAAQEAILTGRRFGGTDAAAAGIVQHAVPADDVLPRAVELAAGLAAKDRRTLAAHKRLLFGAAAQAALG